MTTATTLAVAPQAATVSPAVEIRKWIISGASEPDIMDAIAKTWPDVMRPRPLIVQALKQIAKAGEVDADLIRGFAVEATREIFRRTMEAADFPTALRALKQLVELAG